MSVMLAAPYITFGHVVFLIARAVCQEELMALWCVSEADHHSHSALAAFLLLQAVTGLSAQKITHIVSLLPLFGQTKPFIKHIDCSHWGQTRLAHDPTA